MQFCFEVPRTSGIVSCLSLLLLISYIYIYQISHCPFQYPKASNCPFILEQFFCFDRLERAEGSDLQHKLVSSDIQDKTEGGRANPGEVKEGGETEGERPTLKHFAL